MRLVKWDKSKEEQLYRILQRWATWLLVPCWASAARLRSSECGCNNSKDWIFDSWTDSINYKLQWLGQAVSNFKELRSLIQSALYFVSRNFTLQYSAMFDASTAVKSCAYRSWSVLSFYTDPANYHAQSNCIVNTFSQSSIGVYSTSSSGKSLRKLEK